MAQRNRDKFNFFVETDIHKGKNDKGEDVIFIDGIASSSSEDADGEILHPSGFNLLPLLERGTINFNHNGSKDANAIVGIPLEAKVINDGKDLYFKGMLWDCPQTQGILRVYNNFKKYSPNRKVGYSLEGNATLRASDDKTNPLYKQILAADVTNMAVTCSPKNSNTLMNIIKGDYSKQFVDEDDEIEISEKEKECPKCVNEPMINGKCAACGYTEKAITTETIAPGIPESVDHNPKEISTNKFGGLLKKSEIYTQIAERYSSTIAESKEIYAFVGVVNEKFFSMENTKVSPEALKKAFDLLDEASAIIKSNTDGDTLAGEVKTGDDVEKSADTPVLDADAVEKAKPFAEMFHKGGMEKGAACEMMVKGGIPADVAAGAYDSVVASMNANKDGGTISAGTIQKSEEAQGMAPVDVAAEISKGIAPFKDALEKSMSGFSTIIKSFTERNEALAQTNTELATRVEVLEKTPMGRKSLTGAQPVDRFNKGEESVKLSGNEIAINVTSKADLKTLVDILDVENDKILQKSGQSDPILEKAINHIEMANEVPKDAYLKIRSFGVILQRPDAAA